jgi:hypothetical protein
MRVQRFPESRLPEDIPIAGVTLRDLLGDHADESEVPAGLAATRHKHSDVAVRPEDEFRRFRTPDWTWGIMSGMEGIVVLRGGRVVFRVVTRMN